jgi:hypothetical protein
MDPFWADFFIAVRSLVTSAIVFLLTYALLPFEKSKKKKAIICTLVLVAFGSALTTLIYHFDPTNTGLLGVLFVPLLLGIGILLLVLFFRQDLSYSFFCFVLAMTLYLIIGFLSELLKNSLADRPYLANILYLAFRLAILSGLFPFFLLYLRPRLLKVESELRHHWFLPLVLSSLVFLLLVFIGVFPVDWSKRDSSSLYLIGYSGVFVVGFYLSIYSLIQGLIKQKQKELEQQAMSKKIEALESKITQDKDYQILIDKKKHDLHHHIAALKGLLEEGKNVEALAYLRQYDSEQAPAKKPYRTGSPALDALLAMYLSHFEKQQIDFECLLALSPAFPLSENEIIALFANALENALNGAVLSEVDKPFVSLIGREEKGFYTITLKNSAKAIAFKGGLPLREDGSEGIGAHDIAEILGKHHGFYSFSSQKDVFIFEGALPLPLPHE